MNKAEYTERLHALHAQANALHEGIDKLMDDVEAIEGDTVASTEWQTLHTALKSASVTATTLYELGNLGGQNRKSAFPTVEESSWIAHRLGHDWRQNRLV